MSEVNLQIVADESGEFDRFELGDEVLVSNLCANETIDVQAELGSRGFTCTTRDLAEFVMPIGTADGWKTQAKANVDEWAYRTPICSCWRSNRISVNSRRRISRPGARTATPTGLKES